MSSGERPLVARIGMFLVIGVLFGMTGRTSSEPQTESQWEAATSLQGLRFETHLDGLEVIIEADGAMEHKAYLINEYNQLVLDIPNVQNPLGHYVPDTPNPLVGRVLMYEYPMATDDPKNGAENLARVVLELKQEVEFHIQQRKRQLRVELVPRSSQTDSPPVRNSEMGPVAGKGKAATDVSESLQISVDPPGTDPELFFSSKTTDSANYELGPEDVIEIRVFELEELNRAVRVSGDGKIELPLIGSLQIQSLTSKQVADLVTERLRGRFVKNPEVSIFIREYNSRNVSVLGAVGSPATYPLQGRRNLLQVLADAGGLAGNAGDVLYVFRTSNSGNNGGNGRSVRLIVPLTELLIEGDPHWNIWLLPGDVVSVPPEDAISISILGAVQNPGIHKLPLGAGATLSTAIASAGGLTERASYRGIQIKRLSTSGERILLKANLEDIISGKTADMIIQEGDLIFVKERFF